MWLRNGPTTVEVSDQGGMIRGWWHKVRGVDVPVLSPQRLVKEKLRGGALISFPCEVPPKGFGLSKHGFLRDLRPSPFAPMTGEPWGPLAAYFYYWEGTEGLFPWPCLLTVETSLRQNGFEWTLRVSRRRKDGVSEQVERPSPMPLCPLFQPYFATPVHDAVVDFDGKGTIYSVHGQDLDEGPFHSDRPVVQIVIPHSGTVLMSLESWSGLTPAHTQYWVYRDDTSYVVVEPIVGDPDKFGAPEGFYLEPEGVMTFTLSLRFLP